MIYATRDYNGERIETNATIHKFATMAEAREFLLRDYAATDWKLDTAVIEPGRYGDCWIKAYYKPLVGERILAPFSYTQLRIQAPGQHPGGRMWWIEPAVDVLVVSRIEPKE